MKKILLILLTFVAIEGFSQIPQTAVFDFSKPSQLNPSVFPVNEDGYLLSVFDLVFTSGDVSLTPTRDTERGGVYVQTSQNPTTMAYSYSLALHHSNIKISVSTGSYIKSIEFTGYIADLTPSNGSIGSNQTWYPSNGFTPEVTFKNLQNHITMIETIVVHYDTPSAILTPSACTLIDKNDQAYAYNKDVVIPSFQSLRLAYGNSLEMIRSAGVSMVQTDNDNSFVTVNASVVQGSLVITSEKPIVDNGDFTVIVAEGTVGSGNYQNAAVSYNFKIRKPHNTFNVVSPIIPDVSKSHDQLEFPIILTFPNEEDNYIGQVDEITEFNLDRQKEDESEFTTIAKIKAVKGSDGIVNLMPTGERTVFTTKGIYRIVVPEGIVVNQLFSDPNLAQYNPEIEIVYTVSEAPDPLADLKLEANSLYALIGSKVGFPNARSKAAGLLSNVTAEGAEPTEENLKEAIASFYSEKDVVLPTQATGEGNGWYYIIGVNSENKQAYLQFDADGTKIKFGNSKDEAAVFQAVAVDSEERTVVLRNIDGKYLHIPHTLPNFEVDGLTLTEEILPINTLYLTKFLLEGKEKELLGLFTIYGSLGTKKGNDVSAYTLLDYNDLSIRTDPDLEEEDLTFDADKSNAFLLVEAPDPHIDLNSITPELLPNSITLEYPGDEMTITIYASGKGLKGVTLSENANPYFMKGGTPVNFSQKILIPTEEVGVFKVNTTGLSAGDYGLVMPVGTFIYEANEDGKTVKDIILVKSFKILNDTKPVTIKFQKDYVFYQYPNIPADQPVNFDILRSCGIFAYKGLNHNDLCVDFSKKVAFGDWSDVKHFYGYGHLEPDYEYAKNNPAIIAYKIIWDFDFNPQDYPNYKQAYILMEEATFGDENFGAWLNDPSSVNPEICHVNSTYYRLFIVDPYASGISVIASDSNNKVIFDLQGRRVQQMDKKGVYIVNGRKVVKR